MSAARLAAHIEASGLIRRAEATGGIGVVLARGDREAGTILILLVQRGDSKAIIDRVLDTEGGYRWRCNRTAETEEKQSFNELISARRRIDPDMWVIELDVPDAERFAAQLLRDG